MTDGQAGGEQVFLVAIDPATFERTVSQPVDMADHEDGPDPLPETGAVRLWGVDDSTRNVDTFERMEAGDLLLFHDDGRYVGVGRVGLTVSDESGWAADAFWDGEPVAHLFTVTGFAPVDVSRAAVNRLFDYGPDYSPGGLMRVAPDRVTASLPAIELAVKRYDERED